jgi:hypothetical protein
LNLIEGNSIHFHHKHGLPTTLKSDAVISLVFPKTIIKESKVIFFQFPSVKECHKGNKNIKSQFDFPQYFDNYPTGISLFMSLEEMDLADNYLSKTEKTIKKECNLEQLVNI